MTPALETTRDLHDKLARRLSELSHRATSLAEEADPQLRDELGWLSADIARLGGIVEELQDRERFPPLPKQAERTLPPKPSRWPQAFGAELTRTATVLTLRTQNRRG
jgi:hypothetical protein